MAGADPAELGQRGLAEEHGAAFAQARDRGRVLRDRRIAGGGRATARREALEPDIVFHGGAEPVGKANGLAFAPARLGGFGSFERARTVDDHERIDHRLEFLDTVELVARHFDGR